MSTTPATKAQQHKLPTAAATSASASPTASHIFEQGSKKKKTRKQKAETATVPAIVPPPVVNLKPKAAAVPVRTTVYMYASTLTCGSTCRRNR